MTAQQYASGWIIDCDGGPVGDRCPECLASTTLLLASARAHRAGWVTRPVTVDVDGVPRQRVEHYCPTHKGVTG